MNGKAVVIAILVSGLVAGAAMYYLQVYGFYDEVTGPEEVVLTAVATDAPEPILAENVRAIDAGSSPIRYRACFETPLSLPMLSETYALYDGAVPLNAPGWFDCFDAAEIGARLERGEALAFLGTRNVEYGIDRVVAIDASGHGHVWHQINDCGREVFDGKPAPEGCPPPPERTE